MDIRLFLRLCLFGAVCGLCLFNQNAYAGKNKGCAQWLIDLNKRYEKRHPPVRPEASRHIEKFPRNPSKEFVREELHRMMPQFSDEIMDGKIKETANPFMMFRGNVAYFFDVFLRHNKLVKRYEDVLEQRAWMFGDVHPENFALVSSKKGKIKFVMADPDDAGPGPMFLGYFRLSVGALLASRNYGFELSSKKMLDAYVDGLSNSNDDLPLPKSLEKIAKKLEGGRRAKKKKYEAQAGKLIRKSDFKELTPEKVEQLTRHAETTFPDGEVYDAAEVVRVTGGSAFLKRYLLLMKFPDSKSNIDGPWQIIEYKEQATSGIEALRLPKEPRPSVEEKIETNWAVSFGGPKQVPEFFKVTELDGLPFYIRPKWKSYENIDVSSVGDAFNEDLMVYMSRWLGKGHGQQLDPDERRWYLEQLDEIKWDKFEDDKEDFARFYEESFAAIKSEEP